MANRLAPWSFICDTDICEKISAFWTTEVIPGLLTFLSDTQNGCLHGLLLPLGQASIRFKCLGTVKGYESGVCEALLLGPRGHFQECQRWKRCNFLRFYLPTGFSTVTCNVTNILLFSLREVSSTLQPSLSRGQQWSLAGAFVEWLFGP